MSTKGGLSPPPSPRLCESTGLETLLNLAMPEIIPAYCFLLNIMQLITNKVPKIIRFKLFESDIKAVK